MSFDFDTPIDRTASDSRKWRKYAGRDILPLWVADMDFAAPPAVITALHRRTEHGVFGYAGPLPSLVEATVDYCARHYGWKIEANWIVWIPGLVTGLNLAARAVGEPGDGVLTATPIYPPFMSAPTNQARETIAVPLALRPDGKYEFDWAAMERALTPRTKIFYLCSPHNPVSRVFTRAELEQVAAFCLRHNLVLVSDEIHCDLILDDLPHIPTASLSAELAARTITLMAPSKTYNIAGLGCSFAIIPDTKLRQQFVRAGAGIVPEMNPLSFAACEAAFRDGEPWRQALLAYLRGNRDLIASFLGEHLPMIKLTPCEATYLAWLDVSALNSHNPGYFFEQHGVGLADGAQYGVPAGKFVRLNFGCPRATLTEALHRMQRAVAAR
jgi:cysteine-S-conjugate beta-lyase